MTNPYGPPLTPASATERAELDAAVLTVCDRTDDLGWPRSDTLNVLRALGLVPDPESKPLGVAARERFTVRP